MRSRNGSVVAMVLSAGCKIVQMSTSGGAIAFAWDDDDCAEVSVCQIDIRNGNPVSESFKAVARYGCAFAAGRGAERHVCAGSAPTGTVDIPGAITACDAADCMTVEFCRQPERACPGTTAVQYGIRSDEVSIESGAASHRPPRHR